METVILFFIPNSSLPALFWRDLPASGRKSPQNRGIMDENAGLKMELSEAKREIFKLQNHK